MLLDATAGAVLDDARQFSLRGPDRVPNALWPQALAALVNVPRAVEEASGEVPVLNQVCVLEASVEDVAVSGIIGVDIGPDARSLPWRQRIQPRVDWHAVGPASPQRCDHPFFAVQVKPPVFGRDASGQQRGSGHPEAAWNKNVFRAPLLGWGRQAVWHLGGGHRGATAHIHLLPSWSKTGPGWTTRAYYSRTKCLSIGWISATLPTCTSST